MSTECYGCQVKRPCEEYKPGIWLCKRFCLPEAKLDAEIPIVLND